MNFSADKLDVGTDDGLLTLVSQNLQYSREFSPIPDADKFTLKLPNKVSEPVEMRVSRLQKFFDNQCITISDILGYTAFKSSFSMELIIKILKRIYDFNKHTTVTFVPRKGVLELRAKLSDTILLRSIVNEE